MTVSLILAGCASDDLSDDDAPGGEGPSTSSADDANGGSDGDSAGDADGGSAGDSAGDADGGSAGDSADDTGEVWAPSTWTEELLYELGGVSEVSVQQAVDVFDATISAMPGASRTQLGSGPGVGATYAWSLINLVREELTPEQEEVVRRFEEGVAFRIDVDGNGGLSERPDSSSGGVGGPSQSVIDRYAQLFAQTVLDWRSFRSDLPYPSAYTLELSEMPLKEDSDAEMAAFTAKGQPCDIVVYPIMWDSERTDAHIKGVFAHEIFHCVEGEWRPGLAAPAWVVEGAAEWAALDLYRSTAGIPFAEIYDTWFGKPGAPLRSRSYDAWPLYEILAAEGRDPYGGIQQMLLAGRTGIVKANLDAGGFDEAILSRWATRSVRDDGLGDSTWTLTWPGPDPTAGPHRIADVHAAHGPETFEVKGRGGYAHTAYKVPFSNDVGVVTVTGKAGTSIFHTGEETLSVQGGTLYQLCVEPGDCQCPDGLTPPWLVPAEPNLTFAFVPNEDVGSVILESRQWDPETECESEPDITVPIFEDGDCPPTSVVGDGYRMAPVAPLAFFALSCAYEQDGEWGGVYVEINRFSAPISAQDAWAQINEPVALLDACGAVEVSGASEACLATGAGTYESNFDTAQAAWVFARTDDATWLVSVSWGWLRLEDGGPPWDAADSMAVAIAGRVLDQPDEP